jgi:hypothetical protein
MAKRFKGVPNLPFAPIAAVMLGLACAVLVFATPDWRLERLVGATGLSSILPAAKPPLGSTARTLLAVLTAVSVSGLLWAIFRPIEAFVHRKRVAESRAKARGSFIPAADIEMDANPEWTNRAGRSPIFAERELGAPFMSDEALSNGEELLLEPTETDLLSDDQASEAQSESTIDLSAWQMEPAAAPARAPTPETIEIETPLPVTGPAEQSVLEPLVLETSAEVPERTAASAPKPIADASLSELMLRLETALDVRALDGKATSDAPLAGNIASLHELIGLHRKSVI